MTPAGRAPSLPPRAALFLLLVLAAVALVAMHGRVLRYPFLEDDYIFLTQVRRGLAGSLEHAIRSVGTYFRPLSRELYFWGLWRLFGTSALAFHLVNLAVLLAAIALVALVGARLAGWPAGLLAAAIYTLHYPHRVLLGYVSGSQDLLAIGFACGAALAQVSRRRWLAAGLFFAAMLAKESVVPLVLVFAAWELATAAPGTPAFRLREAVRATLPSWLALAVWVSATIWGRARLGDAGVQTTPFATSGLTLTPAGVGLGARLAALGMVGLEQPWAVLADAFPELARSGVSKVLALVSAAGLAVPALLVARAPAGGAPAPPRGRLALFGLLWLFLLAIPPVLLGTRFNAYYLALPAVGFAWCLGAWLVRLGAPGAVGACAALGLTSLLANYTPVFRMDANDRSTPPGISITTSYRLVVESIYTRNFQAYLRAHPPARGALLFLEQPIGYTFMGTSGALGPRVWLDDPGFDVQLVGTLWPETGARPQQMARVDVPGFTFTPIPDSLRIAIEHASTAFQRGAVSEARAAFARAITFAEPGVYDWERGVTFANLATICGQQGDTAAARSAWIEASRLPSGRPSAIRALAGSDFAAGRPRAAREWLRAGVAAAPHDPVLRFELVRAEHLCGDDAAADAQWRELVALAPAFADSMARQVRGSSTTVR